METTPAALAEKESLDRIADPLGRVADTVLADPKVDGLLRGEWLGHPVHPALSDLPIGFWTSAFVLDLCGRRFRGAADLMVAAGVVTALPTAAAGLADWRQRDRGERRIGIVHAAANSLALFLYLTSLAHRRRGHRFRGLVLGMAGAAAATAGGYLGGALAFGASSQDEAARSPAEDAGVVDQQGAALTAMHGARSA